MLEILVAEEDAAVRGFIAHVLSAAGYLVTAVGDGTGALALLSDRARLFAAAVLDHSMRGLSGPGVVAHLRTARSTLPVLLVSGGGPVIGLDPHTHFLGKPFAPSELVGALARLLASR